MKLGFVGGGVMAEAIISGVLRSKVSTPGEITAADVAEPRRKHLQATYGITAVEDNAAAARGAHLLVLAVKPQNASGAMESIRGTLGAQQTVLSIMAGVTMKSMVKGLGHEAVVRAMPNAPGQMGAGMTVWTATPSVDAAHRDSAAAVLTALGHQVQVPAEKYLDVATAINGSGPAYVFLFIEALIDAGVYMGLSRDLARTLAVHTVKGSATMVEVTGLHPGVLQDMVASPGGTTVEALLVLEQKGFKAAVIEAAIAAFQKSKALGDESRK